AEARARRSVGALEGDAVAELMPHAGRWPFLGEEKRRTRSVLLPDGVEDVLNHSRSLVVRLFDQEAVVLNGRRRWASGRMRGERGRRVRGARPTLHQARARKGR